MALLGLAVLVALTLYISAVTYALGEYSRTALAELVGEQDQERLDWLERHNKELRLVAGFCRLTLHLVILIGIVGWYLLSSGAIADVWLLLLPTVVALVVLAIFAVGIPHAIALYGGERVLANSLGFLAGLRTLFWPIAKMLLGVEVLVLRLLGRVEENPEEKTERIEQEILDVVSEGEMHGAVDEGQKEMIRSIFELADTTASEVMTPRTEIVALPADATADQAREAMVRSGHSRIPAYDESLDHVIGVLYAKDLMRLRPGEPFDLRKMIRTAPFVPETKPIDELLNELRRQKVHIAIVLDEYGGTAGLVTIEDIIEELVGEIDDEYDRRSAPALTRIDEDTLEVDARVSVYAVNDELKIALPVDGEYETIGGFVFSALGKVPSTGERFTHDNLQFQVMDAEARKINRLRIHVVRQEQPA